MERDPTNFDEALKPQNKREENIIWFEEQQNKIEKILEEHTRLNQEERKKFGRQIFDWAVVLDEIISEIKFRIDISRNYKYDEKSQALRSKDGSFHTLHDGRGLINDLVEKGLMLILFKQHNDNWNQVFRNLDDNYISRAKHYRDLLAEKGTVDYIEPGRIGGIGFGETE